MLKRYNWIREKVISVANKADSTLILNRSTSFKSDAEMFGEHFEEINVISTALQKQLWGLWEAKSMLYELSDAVQSGPDDIASPFYQRLLRLSIQWILKMEWPKFSAGYQTD